MSFDKLSFRDAMLEAGVLDYEQLKSDEKWTPSEKLGAAMDKLTKSHGSKSVPPALRCALAAAAAVVILTGLAFAVRPVREGISSAVSGIFGTGHDTAVDPPASGPDGTESESPATHTASETDPEETDVTVYHNDTERDLLWLNDENKHDAAFDRLKRSDEDGSVSDICVKLLLSKERDTTLLNGAGRYIYELRALTKDLYEEVYLESGKKRKKLSALDDSEPLSTRYIRWFETYYTTMETQARGISEFRGSKSPFVYRMLVSGGFSEWMEADGYSFTKEESINKAIDSLLGLFNAVMAGMPPKGCETEEVTEPYPDGLADKIEKLWGSESRSFIRLKDVSPYDLKKAADDCIKGIDTDLIISDTKYFIIYDGGIYMTRAEYGDTDAHFCYPADDIKIDDNFLTTARASVIMDGVLSDCFFPITDTDQTKNGYKCKVGSCDPVNTMLVSRGIRTVESAIEAMANGNYTIMFSLCTDKYYLRDDAVDYIIGHCLTETDAKRRAAMGKLFFDATYNEMFRDYPDDPMYPHPVYTLSDGTPMYDASVLKNTDGLSEYMDLCVEVFSGYAGNMYEEDVRENEPYVYKLLSAAGFTGYKPGPADIAYRSRALIKEAGQLYSAVTYGHGILDENSVSYRLKEDYGKPVSENIPAALSQKVAELWGGAVYIPEFQTQKKGLETMDEWISYFSSFMPSDIVRGFVRESENFFAADGVIYTQGDLGVPLRTVITFPRTARIVEERDGYTVVGFMVYEDTVTEYTVNVEENDGVLRMTGGQFIDTFFK